MQHAGLKTTAVVKMPVILHQNAGSGCRNNISDCDGNPNKSCNSNSSISCHTAATDSSGSNNSTDGMDNEGNSRNKSNNKSNSTTAEASQARMMINRSNGHTGDHPGSRDNNDKKYDSITI